MRKYFISMTALSIGLSGQALYPTFSQSDNESITITMGAPRFAGNVKTGAPYSAEQVSEHVQTLNDGTKIKQVPNRQQMYRDSQGRVRTERDAIHYAYQPSPPPKLIEIDDPVAGVAFILDDQNKLAYRVALPGPPRWVEAPKATTAKPAPVPPKPDSKNEDLGDQNIEGVIAKGTRTTTTWPIDSQGNDRPMSDVSESWFSQELGLTVLSKFNSARNGESTTRLINISRLEPDASLFQVPPEYTVVEEKGSFDLKLKRQ
jgi:hypothetical protein